MRQLPRTQCLNQVHSIHTRPSHISPERRTRTSISLLEELFPEEARPNSTSIPGSDQNGSKLEYERQIPRLKLPIDPQELDNYSESRTPNYNDQLPVYNEKKEEKSEDTLMTSLSHKEQLHTNDILRRRERRHEMTILFLSNVSKSLNESDFRRLVPKG